MKILITGGTGSLGRALTQRLYGEHDITIFSRDETKQGLMRKNFPECRYILGDVAKQDDLMLAFRGIDTIYHFAAYKQVPSAQNNASATIHTNVEGSMNVAMAAIFNDVKQVVATSTDKSCSPANLYGASKYMMESIFQNANKFGDTTFHLARYGNVVCSNASVIPLFKRQALKGGPLTVTHRDMTRFWISLDTAVDLVGHALTTEPGIIVVPKARAMGIVDVAKAVGSLYNESLPIEVIGIRAGEKIHESMVSEPESFHTKEVKCVDVCGINKLFYIYPPHEPFSQPLAPFEYTSNKCPKLSTVDLLNMVNEYDKKHNS